VRRSAGFADRSPQGNVSFIWSSYGRSVDHEPHPGTVTYVVRLWVPDQPGALGAVASRIGAVGGDVVGIDILERGGGQAVDELAVALPGQVALDRLVAEIGRVDGVKVEDVRPAVDALHDPRLDALETAAVLVGARTASDLLQGLCVHGARTVGGDWAAVADIESGDQLAGTGVVPSGAWLQAFLAGSRMSHPVTALTAGPDDVLWAPLPRAGLALVMGRDGAMYRARERRQAAALARIADARHRDLTEQAGRAEHPAGSVRP